MGFASNKMSEASAANPTRSGKDLAVQRILQYPLLYDMIDHKNAHQLVRHGEGHCCKEEACFHFPEDWPRFVRVFSSKLTLRLSYRRRMAMAIRPLQRSLGTLYLRCTIIRPYPSLY